MSIAALSPASGRPTLGRAVAVLTVTQVIGWSTTFHLPAVLSGPMAAGTGLRPELVFGGLTAMLVMAGLLAPRAALLLERHGARPMMVAGSLILTLGLLILSQAQGLLSFMAAWIVIGTGMPLALNQASSTALVQIAPDRARRGLALLLLMTGLSAMVAWPALLWLDRMVGWRAVMLLGAALHALVCAPCHWFGLPAKPPGLGRRAVAAGGAAEGDPAEPPPVPGAFPLAAISFSIGGMLTWGLPIHMVNILLDFGHGQGVAVAIGALFAPAQVLSRAFEMLGGQRLPILQIGVIACGLMPLALLLLLLTGDAAAGAAAFAVGYGLSAGLTSVVRAVAPLRLFGAAGYATMLGRLAVPQNIAFALAPIGFSAVREAAGGRVLAGLALVLAVASLLPMMVLERRARREESPARTVSQEA